MTFDIENLLDFEPPRHRCVRCLAIFGESEGAAIDSKTATKCPACGLGYEPVHRYPFGSMASSGFGSSDFMLMVEGKPYTPPGPTRPIELADDLLEHAKHLASLCRLLVDESPSYPPLTVLLAILQSARSCVHLMTFGMSQTLLGALMVVAQRVEVSGIVAHADKGISREIEEIRKHDEAPLLDLRVYGASGDTEDQPHTKLIMIDGLVAVSGSCNLTAAAWRKVAKNMERIELVTTTSDVAKLNNRYFSTHWKDLEPRWQPPEPSPKVPGGWLFSVPDDPS